MLPSVLRPPIRKVALLFLQGGGVVPLAAVQRPDLLHLIPGQLKIKDIEVDEVKVAFTAQLDDVKDVINNFDWETSKAELEVKVNEVKAKLNEMMARLDEAKDNIKDQAELAQEDLEENFTIVIDTVKEHAKDIAEDVKTRVSNVSDDAKVIASDVADEVKKATSDVVDIAMKKEEK